jgi:ribonuclease III
MGHGKTTISMEPLESRIQYKFRNSLLLAEALTHPSLAYESVRQHFDNQRLEFLGDAVLQLAVTEALFAKFPEFTEGQLTKLRSELVSRKALAKFASAIQLGDYVMLGKGEEASGGRKRHSTLADALEALVGAIYLDSGIPAAKELILRLCSEEISAIGSCPVERNPKGLLQEQLQSMEPQAPVYRILSESGPDHRRVFQAEVTWLGNQLATGRGKSKKEAEIRAATEALRTRSWEKEKTA